MYLYLPKLLALLSDHRVQIVDFDVTFCRRAPREIWVRSFKKCIGTR